MIGFVPHGSTPVYIPFHSVLLYLGLLEPMEGVFKFGSLSLSLEYMDRPFAVGIRNLVYVGDSGQRSVSKANGSTYVLKTCLCKNLLDHLCYSSTKNSDLYQSETEKVLRLHKEFGFAHYLHSDSSRWSHMVYSKRLREYCFACDFTGTYFCISETCQRALLNALHKNEPSVDIEVVSIEDYTSKFTKLPSLHSYRDLGSLIQESWGCSN